MKARILTVVLAVAFPAAPLAADTDDAAAVAGKERFFESEIRPLLAAKCYECHGEKRSKGKLRLDSLGAILEGGESGQAVVPGHPERSLLIHAVGYTDADLQMPPKMRLAPSQVDLLVRWVKDGAVWPGASGDDAVARTRGDLEIGDEDRAWWAFQEIPRQSPSTVRTVGWGTVPLDAFILARLQERGLRPVPPATSRELIRRACFDLIGLPPSVEEVAAFVGDDSPEAWPRLIDRLLEMPQFGERWGRHWLDVVRYAQTNGYERDGEKELAWRYRDYVIRAFNDDKPFDRFVKEQLAGDELDDITRDSIIATAFYRFGVWDDEPDDKRLAEFESLDDILVTTGASFLGLTVGCARCHEHRFDPISQKDYYRLLSFFRNVRYYENAKFEAGSATYLQLPKSETAPEGAAEWALAVREHGREAPKTYVLARGNPATPTVEVQPGFLEVLGSVEAKIAAAPPHSNTTGRRRALAEWIAGADHPLTARVITNRVWQHLFGRGIVRTPNDFGRRGIPPTHPRLLDLLARKLMDGGWRIKPLIRGIMLSSAYRMSSRASDPKAVEVDPGNDLFWRQNMKRLEAEAIRDAVLAASGELNLEMGGRGVFPRLSPDVIAGGSRPGWGWELSSEKARSRRSVYIYVKRGTLMPLIEGFDYTNTAQSLGARTTTVVAPQALMLLNSGFLTRQSQHFAERVAREAGAATPRSRVERAYEVAFGRSPSERESAGAVAFLERQAALYERAASRLVFLPAVPSAMQHEFQRKHRPDDYFVDPPGGWSCQRGRWTDAGDSIYWVDPLRGPFALWRAESFVDAEIRARIVLHASAEVGSLLVRAEGVEGILNGYEVAIDPRGRRIALNRHERGKGVATLASSAVGVATERAIELRVECRGPRIRVWVDGAGEPALDATDTAPLMQTGWAGVRTWGAGLSVESLSVLRDGVERRLDVPRDRSPQMDALASFCLVLMNLNEFVYVD